MTLSVPSSIRLRHTLSAAALAAALLAAACAPGAPPGAPSPAGGASAVAARYPVIPYPSELHPARGSFLLDARTRVVLPQGADDQLRSAVGVWATAVRAATGLPLPVADGGTPAATDEIRLRLDPSDTLGDEGYHLEVAPNGAALSAKTGAGLFHGLETLRQLVPADSGAAPAVPAVQIADAPRFPYRGMHLDVARHFFPVSFVEKYLDLMALYKMNTFQWHLTDDQGWRLQIQKYPRLTEVGSCRKETMVGRHPVPYVGDGKPVCGFYTQDEARHIVEYARERYITVMPEIEMPGHSTAALASYPELACTPGPFEVATTWGVHPDIYCPSERTFSFLEDVLTEVMQIFPSKYIHIGGDEAPKVRWKESPVAQAVIQREGLKDEEELQSYFIQRIEKFLNAHGRRIVGWDEILEGGLAPDATVMSWRGVEGGKAAARQGHDVIMAPQDTVYFDHLQGDARTEPLGIGGYSPLPKVYAFEPIPNDLTPEQARHVLGAQGQVWTEWIATPEHAEYMVFPRELALAEVLWTPRDERDWHSFLQRLPANLERLDALHVNYRIPDVEGLGEGLEPDERTLSKERRLTLSVPLEHAEIHYTLDGSEPTRESPRYTRPFTLRLDDAGTTVAARAFLADGRAGPVRYAHFAHASWLPATTLPAGTMQGLRADYVDGVFHATDDFRQATPTRTATVADVGPATGGRPGERYGLHLSGYLQVPADRLYTFALTSDEGSRLYLDGQLVVDRDGFRQLQTKQGQAALREGWHRLDVWSYQSAGGQALRLEMGAEGMPMAAIGADALAH